MLFLGLLNLRLTWQPVALACTVVSGIGFGLLWWDRQITFDSTSVAPLTALEKLALVVIFAISALIIFNSIYWPFGIDDSVGIYAYWAKQIYRSGALPALNRDSLYEAYPMLVPLWMAFTHSAAGWVDEYLAGLIPALLSVASFGAAFLIGRELFNRRVGILAALLCTLIPAVTYWAGAGYTDLPCAFFYGMAGYFFWKARDNWRYALLTGIMAGSAAWTKNSGLLIVGSLGLWYLIRLVRRDARPTLSEIALVGIGFVAVAGAWYLRNQLYAGYLLPPTGWTFAAQRTLPNLFPFVVNIRYLPVGLLLTAGMVYTVMRAPFQRAALYLAVFVVPFFAVWWLLFSYEPRFLLVVLPFFAVMGAHVLTVVPPQLWQRLPRRIVTLGTAALLFFLAVLAGSAAVDHKTEMLRKPLMSDPEKHLVRLGERYSVGLYLQQFLGALVWTQDPIMAYHADGVTVRSSPYPASRAALEGYDYWIASPSDAALEGLPDPIFVAGGYRVYRLK
jgi:4-amino-4-deoxy-L-arabinose transferase-like glycosyltransferase